MCIVCGNIVMWGCSDMGMLQNLQLTTYNLQLIIKKIILPHNLSFCQMFRVKNREI